MDLKQLIVFAYIIQILSANMNHRTLFFLISLYLLSQTASATFDITSVGQTGKALNVQDCNVQTTLDFRFSPNSFGQTSTSLGSSFLSFLDRQGKDLNLPLTKFAISTGLTSYVSGYALTGSISYEALFQFSDGTNNVYVFVPFTTGGASKDADLVDLTSINSLLASNNLNSYTAASALSAFNFLVNTDYNQWYTSVSSTKTILISKFVYKVSSNLGATSSASTLQAAINGAGFDSTITSTGNKLCYASTTTGNFQTHMRQSVPLWFIWIAILIYWLIYLFSDTTNRSVYNKQTHKDNAWTTWSIYSITHVAHQQFFTRLLRLTVILVQWTIQGVFIASILAAQYTSSPGIIIWSAVIAWGATLIFPFVWGSMFHSRIYQNHLNKLQLKKKLISSVDKQKTKPMQEQIDLIEQKLYGYNHWFYSLVFIIFFICWPITINRMQQTPRQNYYLHWYWLAAMGIVLALQCFIMQPLMLLLFHKTELFKKRGGFYYDHRLGQLYQQVNDV